MSNNEEIIDEKLKHVLKFCPDHCCYYKNCGCSAPTVQHVKTIHEKYYQTKLNN